MVGEAPGLGSHRLEVVADGRRSSSRRTSSKATAFSNIALSCSPDTVIVTELLAAMVLDPHGVMRYCVCSSRGTGGWLECGGARILSRDGAS